MSKHCILLLLMMCGLTACDKAVTENVREENEGEYAMDFEGTMEQPTRAADLQTKYSSFGVWGFKTPDAGEPVLMMEEYEVAYTAGTGWHYGDLPGQHLKYWDVEADNYVFVGVAPYLKGRVSTTAYNCLSIDDLEGHFVHSLVDKSQLGSEAEVTTTATRKTSDSDFVDWLIARTQRTMTEGSDDMDVLMKGFDPNNGGVVLQTPDKVTASVPMTFHPLLTQVEFRLFCDEKQTDDLELNELKVYIDNTVATKATYNEVLGQPVIGGGSYLNTDLTTAVSGGSVDFTITDMVLSKTCNSMATSLSVVTFAELPQAFAEGMVLKAEVTGKLGILRTSSIRVMDNWAAGMRYVYYLKIGDRDEIILAFVDIEKYHWRDGNDIEVEDPVTNW